MKPGRPKACSWCHKACCALSGLRVFRGQNFHRRCFEKFRKANPSLFPAALEPAYGQG